MEENGNLQVHGPIFLIEVEKIKPNPFQPRRNFDEEGLKELASSIREFGLLQPIVVTKIEKETETGTVVEYQLIAGERRLMASKLVGLERIPAIIRSVDLDKERLELAIVENIQRIDLNPIEAARAYAKLQDQFSLTQREIAARIGKSREVIANTIRLLSLPNQMQEAVGKGLMSESQARLLLMIPNIKEQESLFNEILTNNLSVRELKARIGVMKASKDERDVSTQLSLHDDPELMSAERELEEILGAKVKVEKSGSSGKITITFYSPEELHGIVNKFTEKNNPLQTPEREPMPPPSLS